MDTGERDAAPIILEQYHAQQQRGTAHPKQQAGARQLSHNNASSGQLAGNGAVQHKQTRLSFDPDADDGGDLVGPTLPPDSTTHQGQCMSKYSILKTNKPGMSLAKIMT